MRIVVVSGFFNPLHGGHLNLIEDASRLGDKLIIIVKNDKQQILKKGGVILGEDSRSRVLSALRVVDEVFISIDEDWSVRRSLERLVQMYPGSEFVFANGGDNNSEDTTPEADVCRRYGIEMVFGVGGSTKADSSTRINQALGYAR